MRLEEAFCADQQKVGWWRKKVAGIIERLGQNTKIVLANKNVKQVADIFGPIVK